MQINRKYTSGFRKKKFKILMAPLKNGRDAVTEQIFEYRANKETTTEYFKS